MAWTAFIDGGARGNPGPAAAGVHILDEAGQPFFSAGLFLGRKTNNEAEYEGLIVALEVLLAAEADSVEVRSDSELLVRQIEGVYRVKAHNLIPLYDRARSRVRRFEDCTLRHVPREDNRQADGLANQAMDAVGDVVVVDRGNLMSALGRSAAPAAASAKTAKTAKTAKPGPAGHRDPARANTSPAGSVVVAVIKAPRSAGCPAGMKAGQTFAFGSTIPAGLCTEACAAVVDAVLSFQAAMRSSESGGFAPMTITCGDPDCGAVFQLKPS